MKKTVIIKLGGAAITEKQNDTTISPHLHLLLEQIKQAHQRYRVILIHGAGGYGHPPAKQYGLVHGWSSSSDRFQEHQKYGFALTRCQVIHLHSQLLTGLLKLEIPVVSVSPFEHGSTDHGGQPTLALGHRVLEVLSQGLVPMLFGDAVLDTELGCTILSGDVIMLQLAKQCVIERCIFITDVPGVYTANPKSFKNATLIRHILVGEEEEETKTKTINDGDDDDDDDDDDQGGGAIADVTGGMQGKITCARQIAHYCPKVLICQTLDQGALDPILAPNFLGTVFTLATPPALPALHVYTPYLLVHFFAFTLYCITRS